jgi:hypothetical protein
MPSDPKSARQERGLRESATGGRASIAAEARKPLFRLSLIERSDDVEGIRFVTDEEGRKVAVQIDLARVRNRELWEDIHDHLVADSRTHEKRIPLEEVTRRMTQRPNRSGRG